jgi:8-oxo-dGTP diphosphatase
MATRALIPKVLAYITRGSPSERELLVFRHCHYPEAGIQVPGGTVEVGEELVDALHREVKEETGLTGLRVVSQLGKAQFFAEWRDELQERNVFHLEAPADVPGCWVHVVEAGEEDAGLHFEFFWMPINEARNVLRWGQGDWLEMLQSEASSHR